MKRWQCSDVSCYMIINCHKTLWKPHKDHAEFAIMITGEQSYKCGKTVKCTFSCNIRVIGHILLHCLKSLICSVYYHHYSLFLIVTILFHQSCLPVTYFWKVLVMHSCLHVRVCVIDPGWHAARGQYGAHWPNRRVQTMSDSYVAARTRRDVFQCRVSGM